MDEPGDSWPAWKFGMKRSDLDSKLYCQYNTFNFAIQDRDAFHHDVVEIANQAATADDFHRLMADRKQQRVAELNQSLESAALEIISHPALIGEAQWAVAAQLFRTKSLDSLIRYFASYLPSSHPWHRKPSQDSVVTAVDSAVDSAVGSAGDFFDKPALTDEPQSFAFGCAPRPRSPRSVTVQSDSSSSADGFDEKLSLSSGLRTRAASFSESEPDVFPVTSLAHCLGVHDTHKDDDFPCQHDFAAGNPLWAVEECPEDPEDDYLRSVAAARHRSLSPRRFKPDYRQRGSLSPTTRRSDSPMRRKSPADPLTRIQKPDAHWPRKSRRTA